MAASVLIRGAGDLASGVALRLHRAGFDVIMTELAQPLAVRRSVCFAEAIYEGSVEVEGVRARRVEDPLNASAVHDCLAAHEIAVTIDPSGAAAGYLHPLVLVDARMTKMAPEAIGPPTSLYVGLGPGFAAPLNCHVVIETQRGHTLGRAIWQGTALQDSKQPDGDPRRVLRSPRDGTFTSQAEIGQHLGAGDIVGWTDQEVITAPFAGALRGLLRPGLRATKGMKVGDIDARDDPALCRLVSDKSLAIGGGVLEAILSRSELRSVLWA